MFKAYDTGAFGSYMRSVRKSFNLTQQEVEELSGVNIETLRRLEQGKVIPKYETIEFLSRAYKQDLLLVFSSHRTSQIMYNFYHYLDDLIISYDIDKILEVEKEFQEVLDNKELNRVIDRDQIVQLQVMVKGIVAYNLRDFNEAIDIFMGAMAISNPAFSLESYKKNKYDLLESRIMLLIALSYSGLDQLSLSIEMMLFVFKQMYHTDVLTENHIKLIIKLLMNISYDYYGKNDLKKSLEYANKGIKFCEEHYSSYYLFSLFYRRAVAKLKMGKRNYQDDFRYCITLLEMQGEKELAEIYRKRTFELHKVEI